MINKGIIMGAALASVWAALVAAGPAYAIGGVMPGLHNTPGVTLARHMGPGIGAGIHVGSHHIAMHSGPFFGHHHRHFRNFGFLVGSPYYDYDHGGYSCGWLRHRAVVTGSSYWWNRYYDCIDTY